MWQSVDDAAPTGHVTSSFKMQETNIGLKKEFLNLYALNAFDELSGSNN